MLNSRLTSLIRKEFLQIMRDPRQGLRDIGEARILLQEGGVEASHLSMTGLSLPAPEP